MATWFNRDRGLRSGRIVPNIVTPAHGDHVFVLGAEGLTEIADMTPAPGVPYPGDYARVSQVVDLTDYDLLTANMQTIGTVMGQYVEKAGFPLEDIDHLLFWFDFNVGSDPAKNKRPFVGVGEHFDMNMDGEISVGNETYSPNGTFCRNIGEGAGLARMLGDNSPQAFPSTMNEWTLQWWMNFDTAVYPASTGVSFTVFEAQDIAGGLRIDLIGAAGLHEWNFDIVHGNAGVFEGVPILDYSLDAPAGWRLYTLRYKQSLAPPNQCELFVDTTRVGGTAVSFVTVPVVAAPSSPTDVIYGHAKLVGGIDDIQLLKRRFTDSEISQAYDGTTQNADPKNYEWLMQIEINDRVYASRVVRPDEQRTWNDFIAPVRLLTGEHEVAFTLRLNEVEDVGPPV